MPTKPKLAWVSDAEIIGVLEVVRTTQRTTCKTLRQQIAQNIRDYFRFTKIRCGRCGEYKLPDGNYHSDASRINGVCAFCKPCANKVKGLANKRIRQWRADKRRIDNPSS